MPTKHFHSHRLGKSIILNAAVRWEGVVCKEEYLSKGAAVKLADFGLAIEVQGEQQAWFGKSDPVFLECSSRPSSSS